MKEPQDGGRKQSLLSLFAVITAFVLPILIAWLMLSGVLPWLPTARVNYGALIEPAFELNRLQWSGDGSESGTPLNHRYGEWTLAVIAPGQCDETCRTSIDRMQTIHRALGEDMGRVHRVVIVDSANAQLDRKIIAADQGIRIFKTDEHELISQLRGARAIDAAASGYNQILIIDYASRAIMIYPPDADLAGTGKDLKRLLRASRTN